MKKKISRKLNLNKRTIACLDDELMKNAKAGGFWDWTASILGQRSCVSCYTCIQENTCAGASKCICNGRGG